MLLGRTVFYNLIIPYYHSSRVLQICDLSFIFYPSPWDPKHEGSTLFKSEDGEKQIVEYKQNRLVIFPGNMWHQGLYHSNPKHRFTVVYFTYTKEIYGNVKIV